MDSNLVLNTLDKLKILKENNYSLKLPMDNLDQVKLALGEVGLSYIETVEHRVKFLEIYKNKKLLSKYSKANYPNNKFLGQSICNNKFLTEYYLNINNVPTPTSKIFTQSDFNEARKFIKIFKERFVIKPLNMRQGLGVFTDVTVSSFEETWTKCMNIQKRHKIKDPKIIIQNQIDGLEIRINITEGSIQSAILRLQGFLIGDGKKTIEELIADKNSGKKRNPYLNRDLIKFDEDLNSTLQKAQKSKHTILEKNELYIINDKPEIRYGMETYDVTQLIHQNIIELGRDAVLAIPGLHTAGVDIIVPELGSELGYVIEVNKNPAFPLTLYVDKGARGQPLHYIFKSHSLESKLTSGSIKSKEDISEEEFEILLERYKYLFEKDQMNRKIISHFHNKHKF